MSPKKSEVANAQVVIRVGFLDERLDPAVMLHTVGQTISDQTDHILLLERELAVGDAHAGEEGNEERADQVSHG